MNGGGSGSAARVCLAIGAAATVLYLATLSRRYSADSLSFALVVEAPGWGPRIDAYHLFLHPLGWLWVQLWQALGWTGPSIRPLQALNAVAGGISVGLVGSIAARSSGSLRAAALAATGFAVSGGMWLLSTEAEDVTLGLAAHLAALALLLRLPPGGPDRAWRSLALGAAIGAAALTYLNCALLLGVAALACWQGRDGGRRWLGSLLWVGAGFLLVVLPAADFVARAHNWPHLLAVNLGGEEYGVPSWQSLPRGLYAFLRMLLLFPDLGINDSTASLLAQAGPGKRAAFAATYVVVAVAAAVPLALVWKHRHAWSLDVRQRLLMWVVLYAGFAFWWVPSDLEFWLPVVAAWWLPVAFLIARGVVAARVAAVGIVILLLANGFGLILPHRDEMTNERLQAAKRLAEQLGDADAVAAGKGVQIFLRYFEHRDVVRIAAEPDLATAVAKAQQQASKQGGRVFVAGFPLDDAQQARWQARLAFVHGTETVWELTTP